MTTDMIIGRWYQIRHRSEAQHYDRKSVMQYLGVAEQPGPVTHRFNARPVAGTQTMPHSWLISVEEVPATTTPIVAARWQSSGSARATITRPRKGKR